jgi:hypothetical protein
MHDDAARISLRFLASNLLNTLLPPNAHLAEAPRQRDTRIRIQIANGALVSVAMAEPKTKKTKASVAAFIAAVENETRRKDAKTVDKMKLGKHKIGRSCLYINSLADVDVKVLREMMTRCWKHMEATYG